MVASLSDPKKCLRCSTVYHCAEPTSRALVDGDHELDVRGLHEQPVAPEERRQHLKVDGERVSTSREAGTPKSTTDNLTYTTKYPKTVLNTVVQPKRVQPKLCTYSQNCTSCCTYYLE